MSKEHQPEALRLAEFFESMKKSSHRWYDGTPVHEKAASELRRLHARVQELEAKVETGKRLLREEIARANRYAEAAQAQRVPLTEAQIDEYIRHADVRGRYGEPYARGIRWGIRHYERANGITQEKNP